MKRILCLLISLTLLTGCAGIIPSEYATVKPHAESSTQTTQEDAVVVSNYSQLKSAILSFVQECRTEGFSLGKLATREKKSGRASRT